MSTSSDIVDSKQLLLEYPAILGVIAESPSLSNILIKL